MQPIQILQPEQYWAYTAVTNNDDNTSVANSGGGDNDINDDDNDDLFELPDEDDAFVIPAVQHSRVRFPFTYHNELSIYIIMFLVLSGIYLGATIVQLFSIRQLTELMYHHMPRLDLKPGTFIDDRISFFAIFLAILTTRHVLVAVSVWLLQPITQSWKRTLHLILTIFFLIIDVVMVITLLVAWFLLANKSFMPYTPANDIPSRYCNVFQASQTARCVPEPQVLTTTDLHPTLAFYILFITECVFLLFEAIYIILNVQLDAVAAEYRYVAALRE